MSESSKFTPAIANIVRSGAAIVVLAPLTLGAVSLGGWSIGVFEKQSKIEEGSQAAQIKELKEELTIPCIKYQASKVDGKLEREAQNDIDEIMGGEVSHKKICDWVM